MSYLKLRILLKEGTNNSDAKISIILLDWIVKYFSFRKINFSLSFVQDKRKRRVDRLEQVRFLWRHLFSHQGEGIRIYLFMFE